MAFTCLPGLSCLLPVFICRVHKGRALSELEVLLSELFPQHMSKVSPENGMPAARPCHACQAWFTHAPMQGPTSTRWVVVVSQEAQALLLADLRTAIDVLDGCVERRDNGMLMTLLPRTALLELMVASRWWS